MQYVLFLQSNYHVFETQCSYEGGFHQKKLSTPSRQCLLQRPTQVVVLFRSYIFQDVCCTAGRAPMWLTSPITPNACPFACGTARRSSLNTRRPGTWERGGGRPLLDLDPVAYRHLRSSLEDCAAEFQKKLKLFGAVGRLRVTAVCDKHREVRDCACAQHGGSTSWLRGGSAAAVARNSVGIPVAGRLRVPSPANCTAGQLQCFLKYSTPFLVSKK